MPLPLVFIGIAAASAIYGSKKAYDGYSAGEEAKASIKEAKSLYDSAKRSLDSNRKQAQDSLVTLGELKLGVWGNTLGRFVTLFETMKNVDLEGAPEVESLADVALDDDSLAEMKEVSLKATEALSGGLASIGTGTLVGVAGYGGAMMFASASTGTAIASLSGVAATNATLAFFGGGSLAAGGLGMAGGMAVLGGLVLGPALAVGGALYAYKAEENAAKAKKMLAEAKYAAQEMKNASAIALSVTEISDAFTEIIDEMDNRMDEVLDDLEIVLIKAFNSQHKSRIRTIRPLTKKKGQINYSRMRNEAKEQVLVAVNFAKAMKLLVETPLLTKKGAPNRNHKKALNTGKAFLESVMD